MYESSHSTIRSHTKAVLESLTIILDQYKNPSPSLIEFSIVLKKLCVVGRITVICLDTSMFSTKFAAIPVLSIRMKEVCSEFIIIVALSRHAHLLIVCESAIDLTNENLGDNV